MISKMNAMCPRDAIQHISGRYKKYSKFVLKELDTTLKDATH